MSIFSRYKVFTNLAYVDMIDDGINDPRGRAQATAMGAGVGGSIVDSYKDNYVVGFRRKYRRRMSESLLRRYGFLPSTTVISKFDAETYASSIGGNYVSYMRKIPRTEGLNIYSREMFLDTKDLNSAMNKLFGDSYNPTANTLTNVTIGAKSGNFHTLVYIEDNAYHGGKIVQATHSDGTIVIIEGSEKTVSGTPENISVSPPYPEDTSIFAIEMTRISDGSIYFRTGYAPELGDELFNDSIMETTPIITLKEDNVMNPDLDDGSANYRRMSKMLRRLGLDGETLVDELKFACNGEPPDSGFYPSYDGSGNPIDCETYTGKTFHEDGTEQEECGDCSKSDGKESTIDNAYIMIGTYPSGTTEGEAMALYSFFDAFSTSVSELYTVSIDNIAITYTFQSNKTVIGGIYESLSNGDYTSKVTKGIDEGGPDISAGRNHMLEIILQGASSYEIIKVTDFTMESTITSKGTEYKHTSFLWYDDGAEDEEGNIIDGTEKTRIIVPLEFYNNVKYRRWVEVYETGMAMVAYSHEKVKLKWYQTGIFKIVIVVVMAIITFFTAGAGTAGMIAVAEMMFNMLVAFVVSSALSMITDNPLLLAIIAIAMIAYGGGFNMNSMSSFDSILKTADKLLETVNKYTQQTEMAALAADEAKIKELEKENKELEEEYKAMFGDDETLILGSYKSQSAGAGGSSYRDEAQAFLDDATGNGQYNFDYLFDVTGGLDQRIKSESI